MKAVPQFLQVRTCAVLWHPQRSPCPTSHPPAYAHVWTMLPGLARYGKPIGWENLLPINIPAFSLHRLAVGSWGLPAHRQAFWGLPRPSEHPPAAPHTPDGILQKLQGLDDGSISRHPGGCPSAPATGWAPLGCRVVVRRGAGGAGSAPHAPEVSVAALTQDTSCSLLLLRVTARKNKNGACGAERKHWEHGAGPLPPPASQGCSRVGKPRPRHRRSPAGTKLGGEVAAAAGASSPGSPAAGTAGPVAVSALAGGFRQSCLASSLWASPQRGKKVRHPWFELWEMGVSMQAGPAGSRDDPEPTHP